MGLFDKIKGAVFLNRKSTAEADIAELKELLHKVSEQNKRELEKVIVKIEYGLRGEEAIKYELKNSGIPMMVIQDLYLEFENLSAQIDFLIITRDKSYIIESKNMYGDVVVEDTGDFIRKIGYKQQKIYSPITQCERHLNLIRETRKSSKGNVFFKCIFERYFLKNYIPVVVMANPNGRINIKKAPKDIKNKIISVDQLIRFIKNNNSSEAKDLMSEKDMIGISDFFMNAGSENPRKYMDIYRNMLDSEIEESVTENSIDESIPSDLNNDKENVELKNDKKLCARCGSTMVIRVASRGKNIGKQFWGCSKYPKCCHIEEYN